MILRLLSGQILSLFLTPVQRAEMFCSDFLNTQVPLLCEIKGKGHPSTSTEALYRPYSP
jgi:hypothetical protein